MNQNDRREAYGRLLSLATPEILRELCDAAVAAGDGIALQAVGELLGKVHKPTPTDPPNKELFADEDAGAQEPPVEIAAAGDTPPF